MEMTEAMRLFVEAEEGRITPQEYVATWTEARCAFCKVAKVQRFVKVGGRSVNSCNLCAARKEMR